MIQWLRRLFRDELLEAARATPYTIKRDILRQAGYHRSGTPDTLRVWCWEYSPAFDYPHYFRTINHAFKHWLQRKNTNGDG